MGLSTDARFEFENGALDLVALKVTFLLNHATILMINVYFKSFFIVINATIYTK